MFSFYATVVVAPCVLSAQAGEDAPQRPVVRSVRFSGNRAIDDLRLSTAIATTESSWLARTGLVRWMGFGQKRYFDEREFRRDVLRIRLLYNQSGFLNAQVDTIVRREDGTVWVRFLVHEGEPIRVRSLEVSGIDGILPARATLAALPLREGDPFNRFLFQASADTLRRLLHDRGYPWAEIFRNFTVDQAEGRVEVRYDIDPGARARVSEIVVDGADQLGPGAVRRLIPLREGQWYRQTDVEASQRALYRVEAFNYVRVGLLDTLPAGPDDSTVRVLVRVSEGNLYGVRGGVGFGSVDCLRGFAGWRARNFLGGARQLDVIARVSKIGSGDPFAWGLQNGFPCGAVIGVLGNEEDPERLKLNWTLTGTFTQPYFFGRRNAFSLSFTGERRAEFNAYLRQATGGEVTVTHQSVLQVPIALSWSLTLGRTSAEPAIFCSFLNVCRLEDTELFTERRVESMLGLRIHRDRRNSPLDPSSGSLLSLDGRYAAPLIGSDTLIQFTRGVAEGALYRRLGRNTVIAFRLRGGTIVPPRLGLSGQNVLFVPPEQRFYAGGPTTVRGYGQNQLGPVVRVVDPTRGDSVDTNKDGAKDIFVADTITSPTGGNSFFVANAELRFPFPGFPPDRVQAALFVDAGQVIERGNELFPARAIAVTPGLGIRFVSPLGPVRFDVAYNPTNPRAGPLYERQGQSLILIDDDFAPSAPSGFLRRLQLHFSVGQAF